MLPLSFALPCRSLVAVVLILLSPAKTLDYSTPVPVDAVTEPHFARQARALARRMKALDSAALARLMSISAPLADLNVARFKAFGKKTDPVVPRAAVFAFAGDVYDGLDAYALTETQLRWTQEHVRILSGLYGLLLPSDAIKPYRLEMGTSVDTGVPGHLYGHWRGAVTRRLNQELAKTSEPIVVNLASQEYFGAVDTQRLKARVITPVFEDFSAGSYKVISFFAKKARGMMVRYGSQHRLSDPIALQKFDLGGYRFAPRLSDDAKWVFRRHLKESS